MPKTGPLFFPSLLLLFGLAATLPCHLLIEHNLENDRLEMLDDMRMRAQSLAWAIEGVARYMEKKRDGPLLSSMLTEIGRQPGIAWLALVAPDGRIMLDSNPELAGTLLYTPHELGLMQPDETLKGRFSPDDDNIFETWKRFAPERLRPKHHKSALAGTVLFIALNAGDFYRTLDNRKASQWLLALCFIAACLATSALLYYLRRYYISRRNLQDIKALTQQVISNFPDGLIVVSENGHPSLANNRSMQMFGKPVDDKALASIDWPNMETELAHGASLLERDLVLQPKGLPVTVSATRMQDSRGHFSGYLLIMRDMAEIQQLRRNLVESQRFSALGKLAAGLAHEIRNPLSSICGYAAYLNQRLAGDGMGQATATLLEEEARRLNNILSDLLQFSRPPRLNLRPEPLPPLMHKLITLIRPDAETKNINIHQEENDGPDAIIDPERILQAFLNIALNAIQATPAHGAIDISWHYSAKGSSPREIDGPVWRIDIRDTGPGMAASLQEQIFTPYFTTRPSGTGLGLPLARQIIEAHAGLIVIASAPGIGSTFSIFLPAESE